MKATELRIGDYVLWDGKYTKVEEVMNNGYCGVRHYNSKAFSLVHYANVKPIPLTEEILEKNGWKKQCSNLDMPGWSNNYVKLYPQYKKLGGGFSFFYSGNSVQYIHHVHQLQHILWALGIDDNLEV